MIGRATGGMVVWGRFGEGPFCIGPERIGCGVRVATEVCSVSCPLILFLSFRMRCSRSLSAVTHTPVLLSGLCSLESPSMELTSLSFLTKKLLLESSHSLPG